MQDRKYGDGWPSGESTVFHVWLVEPPIFAKPDAAC